MSDFAFGVSFVSISTLQMTGGLEEGIVAGTQVGMADGWGINLGVRGLNGVLDCTYLPLSCTSYVVFPLIFFLKFFAASSGIGGAPVWVCRHHYLNRSLAKVSPTRPTGNNQRKHDWFELDA